MISKPQIANTIGCGDCILVRVKFPYPTEPKRLGSQSTIGDWACAYSTKSPRDTTCLRVLSMASVSSFKLVSSTDNSDFVLMDFYFKTDKSADDFIDEAEKYLKYAHNHDN